MFNAIRIFPKGMTFPKLMGQIKAISFQCFTVHPSTLPPLPSIPQQGTKLTNSGNLAGLTAPM